ncbi:MAG: hypothetical protein ABSH28_24765 [Acidobacteriota bacterium]|jgi:hypothetical protein
MLAKVWGCSFLEQAQKRGEGFAASLVRRMQSGSRQVCLLYSIFRQFPQKFLNRQRIDVVFRAERAFAQEHDNPAADSVQFGDG